MTQTTVYLIDDEPALLKLLADVVEQSGLTAQSYTRASHFFDQVPLFKDGSILVLDLHIPEMDGIEVMRRLAQMENPPSLLLISGHDIGVLNSAEKLGQAHSLEIIASLSKPVAIREFQRLLEQHVAARAEQQQQKLNSVKPKFTTTELHQAIQDDQLVLHYQPQFDLTSGKITGLEALVRWQHKEHGLIYPDHFIPIAEQHGLIGDLTHWVIGKVVQQERRWQEADIFVTVSVNISAQDITSLTLPEQLTELLADNMLDPTRLILEVTESTLMGKLVTSLDTLTRLRLKGVGLSIDDFGTGYSSLSQLYRVPFTELKIDRSFVSNMVEDTDARAIVKTCIILGHELKMSVVAEGVETNEQLELLKQLGCDRAQGMLFSKAVSAEEISEMFESLQRE